MGEIPKLVVENTRGSTTKLRLLKPLVSYPDYAV